MHIAGDRKIPGDDVGRVGLAAAQPAGQDEQHCASQLAAILGEILDGLKSQHGKCKLNQEQLQIITNQFITQHKSRARCGPEYGLAVLALAVSVFTALQLILPLRFTFRPKSPS